MPKTPETRQIVDGLREAAPEIADWHVLHWDVQRLNAQPCSIPEQPSGR
ncbi:hypothetical protein [Streptomyces chromofuscus]|uniref:Uncharacterized protein n=1 Tax=Streptomyces chromofuscus TaxID=42881 RepID=A0A7M2T494_STRCW|nr:hypothetical protein [Streptomyces chromofuscus]QOV42989.1 hypothetical protein IPT68_24830 [Streptomyces chromofuscus]GGS92757.1 hypothetical protein GCM10010254_10850 [Streptomyces chromofuscus]